MSRRAYCVTLICLAVAASAYLVRPLFGADAVINVTGIWTGVNYTSKVPGPHAVKLVFKQDGSKVTGTYCVETGVCGKGEGTISGSKMEIRWKNTTPSCPGEYLNKYLVSEDQMMWKFSGEDCLGSEEGHGYAHRE